MSQVSPEALDQLYTPQEQSTLNQAVSAIKTNQKLLDAIKAGTKVSEGSQTAMLLRVSSQIGVLTGALARGDFAALASAVAGEVALPKLFTTAVGEKALTTGFDVAKGAGKAVSKQSGKAGRVAQVGNIQTEANP